MVEVVRCLVGDEMRVEWIGEVNDIERRDVLVLKLN